MAHRFSSLVFLALALGGAAPQRVIAAERPFTVIFEECDQGVHYSCAALGLRYRHGDGAPRDMQQAYSYFRRACDGGLSYACGYAGEMSIKGVGVAADRQEGSRLLLKACAAGDGYSCAVMRRLGIEATQSGQELRE